jgi:hypothetical protein
MPAFTGHTTGRADFRHPAFRLASPQGTRRDRSGQALEAQNAEFSMNDIECESAIAAPPLHLVPSREEPAHTFKDGQLAGEVQSRAAAIGPQTALPAPQPSHTLGHSLSHRLSHMTYGSPVSGPIVPPAREGHRRRFNEADKHQILEEAVQAGANLSEVARRYGIAARVLFRWKQELTPSAAPVFVAVQITDANAPSDAALGNEERAP